MQLALPAKYLTLQFPVSKTPERNAKLVSLLPSVFSVHQPKPELPQGSPSPLSPGDAERLLLAPPPNIVENQKLEIFWEECLQA